MGTAETAAAHELVPDGLQFEIENNNWVTITKYTGTAQAVVIPEMIQGLPVTVIEHHAFAETGITDITIPPSVTYIGERAFDRTRLTNIKIPASVACIIENAFNATTSLTDIIVDPDNPKYADIDGVLFDKDIQVLIQYPAGRKAFSYDMPPVLAIGEGAFVRSGLTRITIPPSVLFIDKQAFSYSSITGITIPPSIIKIGVYAFAGTNVTSVEIPPSITSISDGMFHRCKNLSSVTIPPSVTSIGHMAFSMTALAEVTIPPAVSSIGTGAFAETGLTHITIPPSVNSIDQAAFYRTPLTHVTLSRRTELGENVFPEEAQIIYSD